VQHVDELGAAKDLRSELAEVAAGQELRQAWNEMAVRYERAKAF